MVYYKVIWTMEFFRNVYVNAEYRCNPKQPNLLINILMYQIRIVYILVFKLVDWDTECTRNCFHIQKSNKHCLQWQLCTELLGQWPVASAGSSPFSSGSAWSSTSCVLRYREEPCDFLVFFLSDRFAKGSILSTNVPEDILLI